MLLNSKRESFVTAPVFFEVKSVMSTVPLPPPAGPWITRRAASAAAGSTRATSAKSKGMRRLMAANLSAPSSRGQLWKRANQPLGLIVQLAHRGAVDLLERVELHAPVVDLPH